MLLFEVVVGVGSAFAEGRMEERRPGTGKKNLEVLPIAADGGGGGGGGGSDGGCGCGGEVFGFRERER